MGFYSDFKNEEFYETSVKKCKFFRVHFFDHFCVVFSTEKVHYGPYIFFFIFVEYKKINLSISQNNRNEVVQQVIIAFIYVHIHDL